MRARTDLLIVIPYGNPSAQNHVAYGVKAGDVTQCGRDCYGWSLAGRPLEEADLDSGYTCKRCLRAMAKEADRDFSR